MMTYVPAYASDYPEIAQTMEQARLPFYCMNCYRKKNTHYLTPDFGPICDDCLHEIQPLLKETDKPNYVPEVEEMRI